MGAYNLAEFTAFINIFIKTSFEIQLQSLFYVLNLTKNVNNGFLTYQEKKIKLLDQFLYGYMQGNMGTYKLMTRFWPTPRNPEIIVTRGFVEFYVTAADQFFSRNIFLYNEILQTEF